MNASPPAPGAAPESPGAAPALLLLDGAAAGERLPSWVWPLLDTCISRLSDIVLITEAAPLDEPGPRIVFVNDAFERLTGYSPQEVIGKSPRLLQGPETDRVELARMSAALRRHETVRAELINYRKDGSTFYAEMDIVPVAAGGGDWTHWVAIQRDVTARKQTEREARVREAQRIESLGTLASGIAHDFNNIIAAILGNVAIGRQRLADGEPVLASLEQIDNAGRRARRLVEQILDYSRRQPRALARQALRPIVTEATELLRATLPAGVALNVRLCDESLVVLADATQLHQVLLNLGTNAWHALDGRPGRIDVTLTAVDDGDGRDDHDSMARADAAAGADHHPPQIPLTPAGRFARIEITDDGCGMDRETLARIYEPYYTTKAIGHGTGLGLSVVSGIVAAHGASIAVDSQVGRGSTFSLLFPLLLDGAAVDLPTAEIKVALAPAADCRVMLIDDDEVVLLTLGALLAQAGFRVSPYSDPHEAIAALRADPAGFGLIVTDLNMPQLSGLQLAGEVAAIDAGVPVVIGSGYVDDALTAAARGVGAAAVFRKEFAVEQLGGMLRDVLARRAAPAAA